MADVVDTNVALVVKHGEAAWPAVLVEACEELLARIMEAGGPVVTDHDGEIVEEYFNQLGRSGAPTLGDAFAKWVHERRWTWEVSARPDIEPRGDHVYGVLDGDHDEIDPSDRKFVAVAKRSGAPVHQATDTKWLDWGAVLGRHGVEVRFVHRDTVRDMYRKKFARAAP